MKTALILEDITETRAWLARVLRAAFPAIVINEAATLGAARQMLADPNGVPNGCGAPGRAGRTGSPPPHPDLALIDLNLPDGNGLRFVEDLKRAGAPTICVITTVSGDDANVVAALAAGAEGYLLKDHTSDVLAAQLRQLSHGVPALSPLIAQRIMAHFRNTGPVINDCALTARETDVLALIARGLRNSEVAELLHIAESTVASYIKAIYRKLGISSRAEASWHATRLGLSHAPRGDGG